eukprot:NODE_18_length_47517_cov_0.674814.p24 type:complete len:136 gc:universal NODE_18_length_47517_cov_0.674814:46905-47312(+)
MSQVTDIKFPSSESPPDKWNFLSYEINTAIAREYRSTVTVLIQKPFEIGNYDQECKEVMEKATKAYIPAITLASKNKRRELTIEFNNFHVIYNYPSKSNFDDYDWKVFTESLEELGKFKIEDISWEKIRNRLENS